MAIYTHLHPTPTRPEKSPWIRQLAEKPRQMRGGGYLPPAANGLPARMGKAAVNFLEFGWHTTRNEGRTTQPFNMHRAGFKFNKIVSQLTRPLDAVELAVVLGGKSMPVIARFYGIVIKMYFNEHGVPHFHAVYGEFNGVFDIKTLEMIEGDLPRRARKLVKDWAKSYQEELARMWKKREYKQLPCLE